MSWPVHVTALNTIIASLSLFMIIFMLLSSLITSTLYMGPAPVALAIGAILGPKATSIINPHSWSQASTVTLEFSRIVLELQTFGNAIELPANYVRRHYISIAYIIGPVMLGGWFVTMCCVKIMVSSFTWREAMLCAACFNAIDPVLAGTILSGKFSRRVPKHLRDLLRTEAAINGLTTTLILDLATSLMQFNASPASCAKSFFVSLAYESVLGAVAGVLIGYAARRWLRKAYKTDSIDRPSFLAYYLSVALFSTGVGTVMGVDEITLAFFAGMGLDNDDWYAYATEETFLSSCLDLMLNLSYFTYIGSLVPWHEFKSAELSLLPWRLALGTLCLFTLRRLPPILLLKGVIPDLKTWREAFFYGHFGPLGAGSLFAALLVQGKLAKGLNNDADVKFKTDKFLAQVWVVVMFVIVCSSVVHGTSIVIFSLAKKINTLTITMSYTSNNEDTPREIDRALSIPAEHTTWSNAKSRRALKTRQAAREGSAAVAYQLGNTIVVEDEHGKVLKTYTIPPFPSATTKKSPPRSSSKLRSKIVRFLDSEEHIQEQGPSRAGQASTKEASTKGRDLN